MAIGADFFLPEELLLVMFFCCSETLEPCAPASPTFAFLNIFENHLEKIPFELGTITSSSDSVFLENSISTSGSSYYTQVEGRYRLISNVLEKFNVDLCSSWVNNSTRPQARIKITGPAACLNCFPVHSTMAGSCSMNHNWRFFSSWKWWLRGDGILHLYSGGWRAEWCVVLKKNGTWDTDWEVGVFRRCSFWSRKLKSYNATIMTMDARTKRRSQIELVIHRLPGIAPCGHVFTRTSIKYKDSFYRKESLLFEVSCSGAYN